MAAPPCSTFSVARFFKPSDGGKGPPPVRTREHPTGMPDLHPSHRRELLEANLLIRRTVALLAAAHRSGTEFIIENPSDRGDTRSTLFLHANHTPLWIMPDIEMLADTFGAEYVTFPQCAFNADVQKYTTLLSSPRMAAILRPMDRLRCTHLTHGAEGGECVEGPGRCKEGGLEGD